MVKVNDRMKLLEAYIENFGKLHKKRITFGEGINVICGANEAGKSTLQEFLTAMLFGLEPMRGRGKKEDIYRKYEPWNAASYYCGRLRFQVEDKSFCLTRNFYHKEKTAELISETDGEELSVAYGDLDMLLGNQTKEIYLNTWCIKQNKAATGKELADGLTEYLANVENTKTASLSIQTALKRLEKQRKEILTQKKNLLQKKQQALEALQVEERILQQDIASLKEQQSLREEAQTDIGKEQTKTEQKRQKPLAVIVFAVLMVFHLFLKNSYPFFLLFFMVEMILILGTIVTIVYFCRKKEKVAIIETTSDKKNEEKEDFFEEQIREKELRLLNVRETMEDAGAKTREELETEQKEKAILLAEQTIQELSGEVSLEIKEELFFAASSILAEITEGRYQKLSFNQEMEITVQGEDGVIPLGSLSMGTIEQVYLAVRIAVGRLLSEERMFFSFDEAFHLYDEKRCRAVLGYLARQPEQSLIFACDGRETDMLERMGISYHKITLA